MSKLLMITGDRALAEGKHGAFYNTIEEFHKYWDSIDILCPKITNNQKPVTNIFGNVFIHSSPLPLSLQWKFIQEKGTEIFKDKKFDVVTVHEYAPFYNGIGARLLWNKIKVPYILEILHVPGHPTPADVKEKLYKNLTGWFIKFDSSKAKAIRVMNRKQVPEFLINAGVPEKKIVHIPAIYIDLETFRPVNSVKKYDLIFVGRLAENKGINLFLETVKKLNCSAIIVGSGPLEESLKFKVRSLKLENKILFHGWAKDSAEIAGLINESKILVMTSYNEGGPRVVVEALACGVPALATPVGVMPDLFEGNMGVDRIDWNADDIAGKAKGLLEDSDKYRRYSQAGPETAKKFERKEVIKNYAMQLQKLI
jgi:glycosyltransferase involved in cell wall biosynthesis